MSLEHGFDGTKNEIIHITLPDGTKLPEFEGYKADFDECWRICNALERVYDAGVVAEGARIAGIINATIRKG